MLLSCGGDGASAFAPDPERSSSEQTIFWAPEILLTVQRLEPAIGEFSTPALNPVDFADANIRRAQDGWHVVLRISGTTHRLWFADAPRRDVAYSASLPLDDRFDTRALGRIHIQRIQSMMAAMWRKAR